MGYFKINQGVLQQNLSKHYQFESTDVLCEQLNKFINALINEKEDTKEEYPWLDKDDERKYMTDRNIGQVH